MKRCPTCQRTYTDDAQVFCANDGTRLNEENAPSDDLQKTMMAPPPGYTPPGQTPSWPPPGGQTPPPSGGQQQGWGQTPPPPPPPYGQQQQYGQQPYGQQGQQQQWGGGGYYQQPGGQAGAYGATPAGQRKGLSIAALALGALSALGALLYFMDVIGSLLAIVLGVLAVILGALALVFAMTKAARWAGKGAAIAAIVLGLAGGVASAVMLATSDAKHGNSNRISISNSNNSNNSNSNNSNSSNSNSSNRNGSTTSTTSTDDMSNHNMGSNSSSTSSGASMSEDEKYRIFYAAGKTNDRALQTEIAELIGIIDSGGQPTDYYQPFISGSYAWAMRDRSFPQTVDTAEKAREYVMAHK